MTTCHSATRPDSRQFFQRAVPGLQLVAVVLLTLLALQMDAPHSAEQLCRLRSAQLPEAEIRLSPPDGAHGQWKGALYLRHQSLLPITLGSFQGYGSKVWSIAGSSERGEYAIPFSAGLPTDSLETAVRVDAYLFPGLGAALYYGGHRSTDADLRLLRAAEGFWQVGAGCRARFVFGTDS